MNHTRSPHPALRPFVGTLWASEPEPGMPHREHVLPSGQMHLVFLLSGPGLRLFVSPGDRDGQVVGHSLVGGPRTSFYIREVSTPNSSVGAMLLPGAASVLFGMPADALAEQHVGLDALWGSAAGEINERLRAERTPSRRLDLLEATLRSRLPPVRALHPAVAQAFNRFHGAATGSLPGIGEVVEEIGLSHRRFVTLFRQAAGMGPKVYCRLFRFQQALTLTADPAAPPLADLAIQAGYSDQSHFNREFREFAGVAPDTYRKLLAAAPRDLSAHHVGVPKHP